MKILYAATLWSLLTSASILTASPTLFVAPDGCDTNDGTESHPLATLHEAQIRLRQLRAQGGANDTLRIHLSGGEYLLSRPLRFEAADAGTPQSPTLIEADPSSPATLSGGVHLTPFEVVNSGLWRTRAPQFDMEQLYVNSERRFRAQTPNRGDFLNVQSCVQNVLDSIGYRMPSWVTLRVKPAVTLPDLATDGSVVFNFYHKWDVTRLRLQHRDLGDSSLHFTSAGMQPWNAIDGLTRFYYENDRSCLDAPGEWYIDKSEGYLYYIPQLNEQPDQCIATAPSLQHLLEVCGTKNAKVENLIFRNIKFQNASYLTPVQGNFPMQAAAPIDAVVMLDYADRVCMEQCEVAHTGLGGVWFRRGCSNSTLTQCHLYDLGACGVKIGEMTQPADSTDWSRHITVDNCIIQHGGYVFPCAVGVLIFGSPDNRITHNDIADFRYSGISVGWMWGYGKSAAKRNHIDYNHVHHIGWGELSDMGGIYTLGPSEGTTVSNNRVDHIYSLYYGGWGLYTDEGSSGITLENNLVYQCKSGGFHQHYGKGNTVRNNIFGGQIRTQLEASRVEEHESFRFTNNIVWFNSGRLGGIAWDKVRILTDHNCFWDARGEAIHIADIPFAKWQQTGHDVHSIVADPGFTPEKGNFVVKNRSVLRKTGFVPFDYTQAGVYGAPAWRERAQLDAALTEAFDSTVSRYEKMKLFDY